MKMPGSAWCWAAAEFPCEGVDQGTLAGPGRSGNANDASVPRRELAQGIERAAIAILDAGSEPRKRARVIPEFLGEGRH